MIRRGNSVIRRQNVLLLVGINHTGGWHYYGCDLLTCALLAHTTSKLHSTTQNIALFMYNTTHITPYCQTHLHRSWYVGRNPALGYKVGLCVCVCWFSYRRRSFLNHLPHISITICSFKCEKKCVTAHKNDGQDKSAHIKKSPFSSCENLLHL